MSLVSYLVLRQAFELPSTALAQAFGPLLMPVPLMRRSISVRLAGALYWYARSLSPNWGSHQVSPDNLVLVGRDRDALVRNCLQAAVVSWSYITEPGRLKGKEQRMLHGMRAVALHYLARREAEPMRMLERAREDLNIAGNLGVESDRSSEHFDVLTQVLVRLAEECPENDYLDEARRTVAHAHSLHYDTASHSTNLADIMQHAGYRAQAASEVSGDSAMRAALSAYRAAALLHKRAYNQAHGNPQLQLVLRAHCGQSLARLAGALRQCERPFQDVLDEAIDALEVLRGPDAPYESVALVGALLVRARIRHKAQQYDLAAVDVRNAIAYDQAHPGVSTSEHAFGLLNLETELRLRDAVRGNDSTACAALLQKLFELPPEARRTPTPIAYAARLLLSQAAQSGLSDEHRGLVQSVVDELIRQGSDPTEATAAHCRYVKSHAAALLGILGQYGVVGLEPQINDLLEEAVTCSAEPPPLVLVVHAGRSALMLAKQLTANDQPEDVPILLDRALGRFYEVAETLRLFDKCLTEDRVFSSLDAGILAADRRASNPPGTDPSASRTASGTVIEHAGEDLLIDVQDEYLDTTGGNDPTFPTPEPVSAIDEAALASRIGEVHLRSARITGDRSAYVDPIRWFELSYRLGNHTPALAGLLGDCLLRLANATDDPAHLQRALRAKNVARELGSVARENLSVSASIAARLWSLSKNSADLETALTKAVEAHCADVSWPWPLLQLAELLQLMPTTTLPDLSACAADIAEAIAARDAARLTRHAAQLAVESDEFARLRLTRSQNFTYVLNDRHNLLSASLVLKQTRENKARVETRQAIELSAYLAEHAAPQWTRVCTPLAIVPIQGEASFDCIYVMRRAAGTPLSVRLPALLQHGRSDVARAESTRALELLGYYHGWSGIRAAGHRAVEPVERSIQIACGGLRLPRTAIVDAFRHALPPVTHVVGYKDAHPGNWIITDRGGVVAIDMESTSTRPMIFELPRLLEDFPVYPNTAGGWAMRSSAVAEYLTRLVALDAKPTPTLDQAMRFYEVFAVVAAAVSLGTSTRPARLKGLSSSGRRLLGRRGEHWTGLIAWIAEAGSSVEVRTLASTLAAAIGPLGNSTQNP
jgi:hypothetical protein